MEDFPDLSGHQVYACGAPIVVESAHKDFTSKCNLPEDGWSGRSGFVHRAVMQDFPDLSACQVYACGVPVMVDSARRDFTTQCKLPEDEFYADSFTTQADLAQPAPSPR